MAFFVQAPIGSLVHMLTASSDFDATFDVSFETFDVSSFYIFAE